MKAQQAIEQLERLIAELKRHIQESGEQPLYVFALNADYELGEPTFSWGWEHYAVYDGRVFHCDKPHKQPYDGLALALHVGASSEPIVLK